MSKRSVLVRKTLKGRLVLALAAVAAVLVIQVLFGASPALALNERPDDTYMTNGEVYATALSGDRKTLYIGGKFSRVRENPSGEPGISRPVSNVAAIDVKTGAAIRTWRPQVTGEGAVVRSLAVKNGRVYIGGNFTAVQNKPRKNLAAVGANTASVKLSPFKPRVGGDTSFVYALEADGSKLYAGGGFSKVNGVSRRNLAAFRLATGALDPAWKPATSEGKCTNPKCSPKVRALELDSAGDSIFVGGPFSYIKGSNGVGEPRQSVARLHTAKGNLHQWKIPAGTIDRPQTAWDLTATGKRLYGGFGSGSNFVAAFRLDKGNSGSRVWRVRTVGNVQTVALDGSRLFFGGHFGINRSDQPVCNDSKYLRGLASLNPATGRLYCNFVPSLDQAKRPSYEGAWTLITTPSYLWVGGGFIGVNKVQQTNLARFTL